MWRLQFEDRLSPSMCAQADQRKQVYVMALLKTPGGLQQAGDLFHAVFKLLRSGTQGRIDIGNERHLSQPIPLPGIVQRATQRGEIATDGFPLDAFAKAKGNNPLYKIHAQKENGRTSG